MGYGKEFPKLRKEKGKERFSCELRARASYSSKRVRVWVFMQSTERIKGFVKELRKKDP